MDFFLSFGDDLLHQLKLLIQLEIQTAWLDYPIPLDQLPPTTWKEQFQSK